MTGFVNTESERRSPMDDLISRTEFLKGFSYHAPEERFSPDEVVYLLTKAPTVAAEPVRHAAWEYFADTNMYGCSVCKARVTRGLVELGRYCRFCGAKMDLDHLGDTTAMVEKEDSR
jgi:hypothetical protein